jgi:hypothetical protein
LHRSLAGTDGGGTLDNTNDDDDDTLQPKCLATVAATGRVCGRTTRENGFCGLHRSLADTDGGGTLDNTSDDDGHSNGAAATPPTPSKESKPRQTTVPVTGKSCDHETHERSLHRRLAAAAAAESRVGVCCPAHMASGDGSHRVCGRLAKKNGYCGLHRSSALVPEPEYDEEDGLTVAPSRDGDDGSEVDDDNDVGAPSDGNGSGNPEATAAKIHKSVKCEIAGVGTGGNATLPLIPDEMNERERRELVAWITRHLREDVTSLRDAALAAAGGVDRYTGLPAAALIKGLNGAPGAGDDDKGNGKAEKTKGAGNEGGRWQCEVDRVWELQLLAEAMAAAEANPRAIGAQWYIADMRWLSGLINSVINLNVTTRAVNQAKKILIRRWRAVNEKRKPQLRELFIDMQGMVSVRSLKGTLEAVCATMAATRMGLSAAVAEFATTLPPHRANLFEAFCEELGSMATQLWVY